MSRDDDTPPPRLLLADDSSDNCMITLAHLADTPYRVEVADTGAMACEMFAADRYDLVLMARQIPVMDGLTATRKMREWERANGFPPTPIIALTASALKGDREACLAAGCTAFLTKPIKHAVLLQAIRNCPPVARAAPVGDGRAPEPRPSWADHRFAHRIPSYLSGCRQNLLDMRAALGQANFEPICRLGHNLSGSGGAFGFQAITDIGAALEQAGESADPVASLRWLKELSSFLDRCETVPS